ncbi:MAG: hypothetical protein ACI3WQ_09175, partial [Faecousia sp.]
VVSEMLKTGDPCPCCGQPIKTKDPEILRLLTCIRDSYPLSSAYEELRKEKRRENRRQST